MKFMIIGMVVQGIIRVVSEIFGDGLSEAASEFIGDFVEDIGDDFGIFDLGHHEMDAHTHVLQTALLPGEQVLMTYIGGGFVNSSLNAMQGDCICAITDRRFIIARQNTFQPFHKAVAYNQIKNVTVTDRMTYADVSFFTSVENFTLMFTHEDAICLEAEVRQIINNKHHQPHTASNESTIDYLDKIKKLKELLDMGAISQEEFDAKKRKLLGI